VWLRMNDESRMRSGVVTGQKRAECGALLAAELARLQRSPNDVRLLRRIASIMATHNSIQGALCYLKQALAISPDHAVLHSDVGRCLSKLGRHDEAIFHLRRAVHLSPRNVKLSAALASALLQFKDVDNVLAVVREALATAPSSGTLAAMMAQAYHERGDFAKAVEWARRAVRSCGTRHDAAAILGQSLAATGSFAEALHWARRHLERDPLKGRHLIADTLIRMNDVERAAHILIEAMDIDPNVPDIHFSLAWCYLMCGNFEQGWAEYEWRLRLPNHSVDGGGKFRSPLTQRMWGGESLRGQVLLLHCEQGFGDTLFFTRYASSLAKRGARVVLLAQPQLVSLLHHLEGVTEVLPYGEHLPRFDHHVVTGSVPRMLTHHIDQIPSLVPYIRISNARDDEPRLDKRNLNVGIVWGGSRLGGQDCRSIDLRRWTDILATEGIDFYSLQTEPYSWQLEQPPSEGTFRRVKPLGPFRDFLETARALARLDVLLTVDTALAHLAGSLGIRALVLLPFASDWRWFKNDPASPFFEKSPWYPSLTLLRQPAFGDWDTVLARAKAHLAEAASLRAYHPGNGRERRVRVPVVHTQSVRHLAAKRVSEVERNLAGRLDGRER
jgi:tetratricopeptide (TPR) repeat protein